MNSYWDTMPLEVNLNETSYNNIVDKNYLLEKINIELERKHLDFYYEIFDNFDDTFINKLKYFFDKFYSGIIYGFDIFKYYLQDSIVVKIYSGTREDIGYIIGKKIKLVIKNKIIDTMEVSFLCIRPEYRKKHLTPYMINILLREFITRYNILTSIYTITSNIKSQSFCTKHLIHRPINLDNLLECNFITPEYNNPDVYNTFDIDSSDTLIYLEECPTDNVLNNLLDKINYFQKNNADIYKIYNINDIKLLFTMKDFHKFLIIDSDKNIKSFVCFFDFIIPQTRTNYKSSSIYMMYFKNYNYNSIKTTLELISQYCYTHNIIDVLSFHDIFSVDNYDTLKCLIGECKTRYYLFNTYMSNIYPNKNMFMAI